jgi:hypothetical protein
LTFGAEFKIILESKNNLHIVDLRPFSLSFAGLIARWSYN